MEPLRCKKTALSTHIEQNKKTNDKSSFRKTDPAGFDLWLSQEVVKYINRPSLTKNIFFYLHGMFPAAAAKLGWTVYEICNYWEASGYNET